MSYAEELHQQMEEKKRKEKMLKQKIEEEEILREQRIKEEIEREKQAAELKKRRNSDIVGGPGNKLRHSPVNKKQLIADSFQKSIHDLFYLCHVFLFFLEVTLMHPKSLPRPLRIKKYQNKFKIVIRPQSTKVNSHE